MSDSPEPEGPPVAPEMSRRSRRRNRSRDAGRDEEQPAATNGMHPPAADAVVIIGAEAERRARHQASDAQVVILGAGAERETSAESGLKDSLWNDIRRPLTAAFIITLCIGIVAELIGGLTGTISAAVAMGLYFVFGITRPKGVRNTEQFADSLYYLGFILTLWALFLAMAPHLHGAGEITSQGIIEKFGIAIVTTFMGMSLRIILIQLRQTSTDQEEEARESIAQYVVQLNQEIAETISQLKQFRHTAISTTSSTAQQFADDLRRLGASSEQAVKDSNTAILKSVQEIMARMDASMQEVIARLQ